MNKRILFSLLFCIVGTVQGYFRGYHRTLNREQADFSRTILPKNHRRYWTTGSPRDHIPITRGSLGQWTQEVVEPQEIMGAVEGR